LRKEQWYSRLVKLSVDLRRCLPHHEPALLPQWAERDEAGLPVSCLMVEKSCYYVHEQRLTAAGTVEAMAQAAAVHQAMSGQQDAPVAPGVLIGFDQVEVRHLPEVGDRVRISCEVERLVGPALWVNSRLYAGDLLAALGTVKIYLPTIDQSQAVAGAEERGGERGVWRSACISHDIESCTLESVVDGEEVRALCRYRSDMGILEGHFPGNPLVPGVYCVELSLRLLTHLGVTAALPCRMSRAKLARPIKPGMAFSIALNSERIDGERIRAVSVLREEADAQNELARLWFEVATPR
jgi:3-hydroxymyristoyl/3-hydroxydecanoyl-(acyl carrier protein) dehydratase